MKFRHVAAVLLIAAGAGCQTVGSVYDRWFGSSPGPKPAPLVAFQATTQPRIAWRGDVGSADRNIFFPTVTGNIAYAASAAGSVVGFDTRTGNAVARLNAGQRLSSGVGASASLIAVGSGKGEVLAFETSGKPLW